MQVVKYMNSKTYNLRLFLLDLPKSSKIIISLLVDLILCFLTTWLSFYLRLGELFPIKSLAIPALISVIFAIPVFYLSGLYRTIFRYSGWPAMLTVSKSIFIYGFVFSLLNDILLKKLEPYCRCHQRQRY